MREVKVSSARWREALAWLQAHGAVAREGRISIEQTFRWMEKERDGWQSLRPHFDIDLSGFKGISRANKMLFKLMFAI